MLKRILQFSALALLLVPGAAFADTFNLAGGTWTESGNSFTLTDGSTTLKTGDISSFFFFGTSDTGSVGTTAFSCTDCVTTTESFTLTGFFTPTIVLSGTVSDGGVTGAFTADLVDMHDLSGTSGTIESGSIDLDIPAGGGPTTPAPEPSTWVLLLVGVVMLGTTAVSRKMGWLSQVTEQGSES
jgi:hypothetical protein